MESGAADPWRIPAPDAAWSDGLHGHGWLDDAAATGDAAVWNRLSAWVWTWIEHFGDGSGPGWRADLVARRLTRWIAWHIRLLNGQPPARSRAFFRALDAHARYLDWCWRQTDPGARRIEALVGRVYAALSLEGSDKALERAMRDLGREADALIGPDGGIGSRNPEELARMLELLRWSAGTLEQADLRATDLHLSAMARAAPVVRSLTTPAGALARFHGGRGDVPLPPPDGTVAAAGAVCAGPVEAAMGYLRLTGGDTLLILDAAPPPRGRHRATAHASALAFELWQGTRPVIVNAGSGAGFGEDAHAESRRTAAHTTVEVDGRCFGTLSPSGKGPPRLETTGDVTWRALPDGAGASILCTGTLYAARLGLTVERRITLSADGRRLSGEDTVLATGAEERARITGLFPTGSRCAIAARFHLHPDVQAALALGGRAAALTLPGGGTWLLRADGARLELERASYHDPSRPRPRATAQVVARGELIGYWGRIGWSLQRMADGALRDEADRTGATL